MKPTVLKGDDPRLLRFQNVGAPFELRGRDVVHLHHNYPREHESFCGVGMSNAYDVSPQAEFDYKVCTRCLKEGESLV